MYLSAGFEVQQNGRKSTKLQPGRLGEIMASIEKNSYLLNMSCQCHSCRGMCWCHSWAGTESVERKHAIWTKWAVHNSTVDFQASTDYKWGHHHPPPSDRNSKLVDCTKGNGLFNFCIRPLQCGTICSTEIAISSFSFEFRSCVLWCDLLINFLMIELDQDISDGLLGDEAINAIITHHQSYHSKIPKSHFFQLQSDSHVAVEECSNCWQLTPNFPSKHTL